MDSSALQHGILRRRSPSIVNISRTQYKFYQIAHRSTTLRLIRHIFPHFCASLLRKAMCPPSQIRITAKNPIRIVYSISHGESIIRNPIYSFGIFSALMSSLPQRFNTNHPADCEKGYPCSRSQQCLLFVAAACL